MEDLGYVLYMIGCFLLGLSVPDVIKKIRKRMVKGTIKDDRFIDVKRTYGQISSSLFEKYKNEWHEEHDGAARRERLNALIIERDALLAEDDRNLQEKGEDNFKTGLKWRVKNECN